LSLTKKLTKTGMGDPKPSDRVWVKQASSGLVGYLVMRDGVQKVKLDRPDPYALRPYDVQNWSPMGDELDNRLPRMALAQVQWAADQSLLRVLGTHSQAGREWRSVPQSKKIQFMTDGPTSGPGMRRHLDRRRKLWLYVKEAMLGLVEGDAAAKVGQ